jgi:hypothetical protein
MDIFFQDPEDIPLPPDEVRIRTLQAEPWPDRRRVLVYLELTPFQQKPNAEINVVDENGEEVTNLSIIETINPKMEFTIHLRTPQTGGEYRVSSKVYYTQMDLPEQNNPSREQPTQKPPPPPPTEIMVVDTATTTFKIDLD